MKAVRKIVPLVATIALSLFLLQSVFWVVNVKTMPDSMLSQDAPRREKSVLDALDTISQAQQKYFQIDPEEDGIKGYCRFLPHLWQTVRSADSVPVRLGFIRKELAFAIVKDFAYQGYQFSMLRARQKKGDKYGTPLDYSREWCAVAYPATFKFSDTGKYELAGRYVYIINQDGVYRKVATNIDNKILPENFPSSEWEKIR